MFHVKHSKNELNLINNVFLNKIRCFLITIYQHNVSRGTYMKKNYNLLIHNSLF